MPHGTMMAIGDHKADAGFTYRAFGQGEVAFRIDTENSLHIRGTRAGRGSLVAMLGDRNSSACCNECRRCGNIKGTVAITAGSDHIDGIFWSCDIGGFLTFINPKADQAVFASSTVRVLPDAIFAISTLNSG